MACTEGARSFLVVFNFIFWLSGAALLGVGVWLSVDKDIQTFFDVIHIDTADPYFKYSAYILVGFGAFVFLVGFLGCCGALRRHKGLLGMYIFFLVVVMAGELAAGILTAVYKNEIESRLKGHLLEGVEMKYGHPKYPTITRAMDVLQTNLRCCGVESARDYESSAWKNSTSDNVPLTCCHLSSGPNEPPVAKDKKECQANAYQGGAGVYSVGCYPSILHWFRDHSAIVIGVGCGIAGLELFGLVFAVWMCCDTRKDEEYD
ncbi:tetraspanin-11-like [Liolophura sinensis]|uniref:tetraspanin-11-like n=1 Tax=Liolophura sinensis TaxID=3198878 RepID=UPI0031582F1B